MEQTAACRTREASHHMFLTGLLLFCFSFVCLDFAFCLSLLPPSFQTWMESLGSIQDLLERDKNVSDAEEENVHAEADIPAETEKERTEISLAQKETETFAVQTEDTPSYSSAENYTYLPVSLSGIIVTESAAVRSGPDISFETVGWVESGEEISVDAECEETGWYRISFNGEEGYVSYKYLHLPEKEEHYTFSERARTLTANTNVHIRSGPASHYLILGIAEQNTVLISDAQCAETGWYRVTWEGETGYVSNEFVKEEHEKE